MIELYFKWGIAGTAAGIVILVFSSIATEAGKWIWNEMLMRRRTWLPIAILLVSIFGPVALSAWTIVEATQLLDDTGPVFMEHVKLAFSAAILVVMNLTIITGVLFKFAFWQILKLHRVISAVSQTSRDRSAPH